ncbi:hypothetical protein MUP79_07240 [Candidatus Bathyarchaeota archaeon]|nr:hypothetical protein [Candidatus Bathyarchaeota archaeon]
MLIDFEQYCGRITDEIFKRLNVEYDHRYTPKARKVFRWIGVKAIPFILQIATFIILYNIYNRIVTGYGIEKLAVLIAVIFTLSLRTNQKK